MSEDMSTPLGCDIRDAPGTVLAELQHGISEVVRLLGPERVRRAFAAEAGCQDGPLDAQRWAKADARQGAIARASVGMALTMMAPAIGGSEWAYLAHSVARLANGSEEPNVLTAGAAKNVRWDPASRVRAIQSVLLASRMLSDRSRAGDKAVCQSLDAIGLREDNGRSRVRIELALLRRAGHPTEEHAWDRAKSSVKDDARQQQVLDIAARYLMGALADDDRELLGLPVGGCVIEPPSEGDPLDTAAIMRQSVFDLVQNADPINLDHVLAQIHLLWARKGKRAKKK